MAVNMSGSVTWVTGASQGMGRALALALARNGHTVAMTARSAELLAQVIGEAGDCAERLKAFPGDITDPVAMVQTVARIENAIGPIELAILNAGTHRPMWLDEFDVGIARSLMEVNYFGTLNCMTPLIGRMRERGRGHIGVVASVAGYCGLPSAAAYGGSKAALINFCEALRPEFSAVNLRLTLINPGFVDTPLTRKNSFPMPSLISADDAAAAILSGLARTRFEITFPWRFSRTMKLLAAVPYWLFFRITSRMKRK